MNRSGVGAALGAGLALLIAASAAGDAGAQGGKKQPAGAAATPGAAGGGRSDGKKAGGSKAKPPKPSKAALDRAKAIEARLKSQRREEILAGLEEMNAAEAEAAPAAPAAEALLSRGLPTELAQAAIRSLGAVRAESSTRAIAPYAVHRDVNLRRAAVKALPRTGGPDAVPALRRALSDPDAMVRGLAATGLGALGAKDSVDALFVALDHKVPEAAGSIGQLCNAEQCERFAAKTGQFSFDVMTSGFEQMLFREGEEVSEEQKLRIVGRVREIGTGDAHRFLQDVQTRWPAAWSRRVKQAIDLAVSSTAGAPGGKRETPEGQP